MKAGTTELLKFKKLARRLNLRVWQTMGLLECLWHVTAKNRPMGDIGYFSNDDIALLLDWDDSADELIEALVETCWLDRDDEFRLIVHDWSEHVPNYLKGNFSKHHRIFADEVAKQRAKEGAKQVAKEGAKQPAKEGAKNPPLKLPPNQANPNQVNPPPPTPSMQFNKEAAAEILVSLGVEHPIPAIESAANRGITQSEFQAIVDHFQLSPKKYGPAALQKRVSNFIRGQPPDQGWPGPSLEWKSMQAQKREADELRIKADEQKRRRAADDDATNKQEQKFRARFDALTDEEIKQRLHQVGDSFKRNALLQDFQRRGRGSPSFRTSFYKLMEENPLLEKSA
ncbi:hypothetical protein [uncultured Rubinisphaera sp.]|uniref:hypothetical protein n=1 Tax=uncultured Rubinisphaera sp. TaxID=1678686 RepID=UPI0030DBFEC3